jgi:hypothetical protein
MSVLLRRMPNVFVCAERRVVNIVYCTYHVYIARLCDPLCLFFMYKAVIDVLFYGCVLGRSYLI